MGKLIDISVPVREGMIVWPGDGGPRITRLRSLEEGSHSNFSGMECSLHTGTHIDAPLHFISGANSIDRVPLEVFIGPAQVLYFPDNEFITADDLENSGLPDETERLLLKTRNSDWWKEGVMEFREDYVALTDDAARWVVEHGIKLLGVDYLSIDHQVHGKNAHSILLGAGLVLLETINLSGVEPGEYELFSQPLNLIGAEGSPVRAVLKKYQDN
ncbi:MAG: cyclase family protein [Planctomycetota bacterium]|nr:MAG: cyclase family protein [Planctomycetota bacterium]